MIKLRVKQVDGYHYTLSTKNQEYLLKLVFYGLKEQPNIDDMIYMNKSLLTEKNIIYCGQLENKCGKPIFELVESEFIVLEKNHQKIYLKRLYG